MTTSYPNLSPFHDYITTKNKGNGEIAKTKEMAKFQVVLFVFYLQGKQANQRCKLAPCSLEFIKLAYQPWNNVFPSQQISFSRLISRKNYQPNSSLGCNV
jgi:hypothetical protein